MGRTGIYNAGDTYLCAQAEKTSAQLVGTPEITKRAYDRVRVDGIALGRDLAAAVRELREASSEVSDQASDTRAWRLQRQRAAREGFAWWEEFRHVLKSWERRPAHADLRMPRRRVRKDRPASVLAQLRDVIGELERLGPRLLTTDADRELLARGRAHLDALDARDRSTTEAEDRLRHLQPRVQAARATLIARFEEIDRLARLATSRGAEVVPGRSREVLVQWARTRPGQIRARRAGSGSSDEDTAEGAHAPTPRAGWLSGDADEAGEDAGDVGGGAAGSTCRADEPT